MKLSSSNSTLKIIQHSLDFEVVESPKIEHNSEPLTETL